MILTGACRVTVSEPQFKRNAFNTRHKEIILAGKPAAASGVPRHLRERNDIGGCCLVPRVIKTVQLSFVWHVTRAAVHDAANRFTNSKFLEKRCRKVSAECDKKPPPARDAKTVRNDSSTQTGFFRQPMAESKRISP
jgi:hypothetical protein